MAGRGRGMTMPAWMTEGYKSSETNNTATAPSSYGSYGGEREREREREKDGRYANSSYDSYSTASSSAYSAPVPQSYSHSLPPSQSYSQPPPPSQSYSQSYSQPQSQSLSYSAVPSVPLQTGYQREKSPDREKRGSYRSR